MQHNRVGVRKLFKQFGHFSLVLLFGVSSLSAQSFEDFKRTEVASFQKYKDEKDEAFNKYLKAQWKEYNVYKGTPLYEKPKPKSIAQAKPLPVKSVGPKVRIEVASIKVPPQKEVVEKPIIVVELKPEPKESKVTKAIMLDFYGTTLGFDMPRGLEGAKFYPQNQKGISNFFDTAASSEYEVLVSELLKVGKEMQLNDWGLYLLVLDVSNHIFKNEDDSRLLSWFLFNKLGYAVKIGLANKHTILMHYSQKVIYSTPNYTFGGKKYYVVSNYAKGSVGNLYSYEQSYPGADKALDLALPKLPLFNSDIKSKTLSFKELGKEYTVPLSYNQNLINFMATYPQADYETFFNAPVDALTYKEIATALKKYVDGKHASDAMNFVLHFVQKSFEYQIDDQQFGREKVMFAQETLYFEKSDCEDRAILFSYLIKELFGVGVIGVKYKDHMTTALNVPMEGDLVRAGSRKFVVADPTYINATIGQSMPQYKSLRPENFIVVQKDL